MGNRRRMMNPVEKKLLSVITINQAITDPFTRVSGDINGDAIKWIRANSHRVLAKKTADGVLTYCRLDDSNSNYYYDGTPANLTGSEGDVFVKLPKFYYYGTEGNTVNIYFANYQVNSNYVRWDPNILIGAYESYNMNSKMYSISNVISTPYLSQEKWENYASSRGSGYQPVDWQMHCVIGCLYFAMYGNTDCKSTVGRGTDSCSKKSGQTNNLGMTDTVAGGNGDSQSINFWGLENWWGNKNEFVHDFYVPANKTYAIAYDPVNGGTRVINFYKGYRGWVNYLVFGKYLDICVKNNDTNYDNIRSGYCEWQCYMSSKNSNKIVMRRSSEYNRDYCGVSILDLTAEESYSHSYGCSRLAFRGNIVEVKDVQTFKSIAATN